MWIRCNPNPLGKQTSDCVVRAIAIATDASWRRGEGTQPDDRTVHQPG